MKKHVIGIFDDKKKAQAAVEKLLKNERTESVSFIHKTVLGDTEHSKVKEDISTGATLGSVSGGSLGAILGLASQTITFAAPIGSLTLFGPLAPAVGLVGATTGALAGGLVGALTDFGLTDSVARQYQRKIINGETLVGTEVEEDDEAIAVAVLQNFGADLIEVLDAK